MASKNLISKLRNISAIPRPFSLSRTLSIASSAAIAEPPSTNEDSEGITMKGVRISGRPLYLDMQATSPVDPIVLDAMLPYYLSQFDNPHSRTHLYGWESESAVETACSQVPVTQPSNCGRARHAYIRLSDTLSNEFPDIVRGLAVMSDFGILSASHDGYVRLWALTGEVLMEMVGHTSIVYSVDSHISGLLVSGSEDCSAKIWKEGTHEEVGGVQELSTVDN